MIVRAGAYVSALLFATLAASCGGGGGGGGSGSTAAASTSGSTTGGGSSATNPNIAAVTSLRLPAAMVLSGDVPVVFKLTDPRGAPATVKVEMSTDNGAIWRVATPAATSAALANLVTAPAPGAEHIFTWASRSDVPSLAQVLVRASLASGGPGLTAGPAVVENVPLSTAVRFNRRAYLQNTRQTATVVLWRTETDTDSVVEFGATPLLGRTAGDPAARTKAHEVELTGLTAGAPFYYRVVSGGQPLMAREQAETAPTSNDSTFTFLAFGDSGTLSPGQRAIATLMATESHSLAIHTGDVIYPYGALGDPVGEYNDRYFRYYEPFIGRMTVYPVIGNHDLYALLGRPFKQAFVLPDNGSSIARELYFSFEWGDAKFIALETTGLFRIPLGDHMRWLQRELQTNTKKWIFVYMHAPMYSSGMHGDSRLLQHTLGPLLENHGVDLVLAGHDHNYERTKPIKQFNQDPAYPGLVHILTGGGGAGLRAVTGNPRSAVAVSAHHYMRFNVQGDTLTGEAVDQNGAIIDTFTIQNIP